MIFKAIFHLVFSLINRDMGEHKEFYEKSPHALKVVLEGPGASGTTYVTSINKDFPFYGYLGTHVSYDNGEIVELIKSPCLFGLIHPSVNYVVKTKYESKRVDFLIKSGTYKI